MPSTIDLVPDERIALRAALHVEFASEPAWQALIEDDPDALLERMQRLATAARLVHATRHGHPITRAELAPFADTISDFRDDVLDTYGASSGDQHLVAGTTALLRLIGEGA
jgi:hypothetical protein